jgi:hypothetical protein
MSSLTVHEATEDRGEQIITDPQVVENLCGRWL